MARVVATGCVTLALGPLLAGCGAEKQTVTPPPPVGATPAGDNPEEYRRMMQNRGMQRGGPGGGMPGGPPGGPGR